MPKVIPIGLHQLAVRILLIRKSFGLSDRKISLRSISKFEKELNRVLKYDGKKVKVKKDKEDILNLETKMGLYFKVEGSDIVLQPYVELERLRRHGIPDDTDIHAAMYDNRVIKKSGILKRVLVA